MTQQQQQGDPWGKPTGSNLFSPSDHVGATVLIAVRAFHTQVPGTYGARDAVEVGLDIVAEPNNPAMSHLRFDAMLYGVALVDELKDKTQSYVLGRLTAKPSKNPSPVIVLDQPSPQEEDLARQHAQQYGLPDLTPKPPEQVAQMNQAHAQQFQQQYGQQQPQPQQQYGQPAPWQQAPPAGPQPPYQSQQPPF